MTTQSSQPLHQIFEAYHDYVNEALMFDTPLGEIAKFTEWADLHYGIDPLEAASYLFQMAA